MTPRNVLTCQNSIHLHLEPNIWSSHLLPHSSCYKIPTHIQFLKSPCLFLYNPIERSRHKEACESKPQQPSRNAPKPHQRPLLILSGHPHIHAPQPSDDIHRQYDRSQHGQLSENVCCLLLPLVHAYVYLREVIAMGARENPIIINIAPVRYKKGESTSHNDSNFPS